MSDRELLIGRIVDRAATPTDWARFEGLSADDVRAKDELLDALRDESLLCTAVASATAVADRVDVDVAPLGRRRHWIHWSGWLAAAVLVILWMATDPRMKHTEQVATGDAAKQEEPIVAKSAAVFLRELPNVMVETRPIPGSEKTEVLYVRRTLERTVVSGAYQMATDESGQPVQVQADLTQFAQRRRY